MLCRLCGEIIGNDEPSLGFGTGLGQDFVHSHCYVDYKQLNRIIFNSRDHKIMKLFNKLIEVHKTLIRQREQELK